MNSILINFVQLNDLSHNSDKSRWQRDEAKRPTELARRFFTVGEPNKTFLINQTGNLSERMEGIMIVM